MIRSKNSSILIILLLISFFTIVQAFWADSILVDMDMDTANIGIGDFQLPSNNQHIATQTALGETFLDGDILWLVMHINFVDPQESIMGEFVDNNYNTSSETMGIRPCLWIKP